MYSGHFGLPSPITTKKIYSFDFESFNLTERLRVHRSPHFPDLAPRDTGRGVECPVYGPGRRGVRESGGVRSRRSPGPCYSYRICSYTTFLRTHPVYYCVVRLSSLLKRSYSTVIVPILSSPKFGFNNSDYHSPLVGSTSTLSPVATLYFEPSRCT